MPESTEIPTSLAARRFTLVMVCIGIGFTCGAAALVVSPWFRPGPWSPGDVALGIAIGGIAGAINGCLLGIPVSFLVLNKPMFPVAAWLLLPSIVTATWEAHFYGIVNAWFFSSVVFLVAASLLACALRDLPIPAWRLCRHCGYSLEGLRGELCPECGKAQGPEQ